MKSGESFSGRITYEGPDIVKIEVPISQSIKETKTIARDQIESVVKDAPDDVAFRDMQNLLPADSLLPASAYRSMIDTGPGAFLENYPDSKHVEKVKEMKQTLEEELEKVERGYIKLEEDWISPQEKLDFEELVESRIHYLRMDSLSKAGNYAGFIGAMREYEIIEENHFGSPAFPKAVTLARQIVPALGGQLQRMLRDVEARNAEYERNKAALDEIARQQVEAARAKEEAVHQSGLEADKAAGIKWVRLNPRSKASIEEYLKLASAEMESLQAYDVALLTAQAEKLVEVDKLIAEDKLGLAKSKLSEAAAMPVKVEGESSKSSRSKKKGGASSYLGALNTKLNERLADEAAVAKAREEAKKSEALTQNLKNTGTVGANAPKEETAQAEEGAESTESPAEEKPAAEEPLSTDDAFAALAKSGNKKEDAADASKEKKSKSSKSSKDDDDDDDERAERTPPPVDEGGGFSLGLLVPIVTVLLIAAIVLMKVLGIGGKKEEA